MVNGPTRYTPEYVLEELTDMMNTLIDDEGIFFINQLVNPKPYSRQRFSEWGKTYKDNATISDIKKKIEDILESRIVTGGMSKLYDKTMTIFLLKNKYGWEDRVKQDIDQTSSITTININKAKIKKKQ